jgi:hypothetical protein
MIDRVKMEYKIVFETDVQRFEEEVNSLIKAGWVPIGGASVSESTEEKGGMFGGHEISMSFVQAMIKK